MSKNISSVHRHGSCAGRCRCSNSQPLQQAPHPVAPITPPATRESHQLAAPVAAAAAPTGTSEAPATALHWTSLQPPAIDPRPRNTHKQGGLIKCDKCLFTSLCGKPLNTHTRRAHTFFVNREGKKAPRLVGLWVPWVSVALVRPVFPRQQHGALPRHKLPS